MVKDAVACAIDRAEPKFVWHLPNMRQLNESRRTFQVRNALLAQNAIRYQPRLPKNISKLP
jgi:hypothetical protein